MSRLPTLGRRQSSSARPINRGVPARRGRDRSSPRYLTVGTRDPYEGTQLVSSSGLGRDTAPSLTSPTGLDSESVPIPLVHGTAETVTVGVFPRHRASSLPSRASLHSGGSARVASVLTSLTPSEGSRVGPLSSLLGASPGGETATKRGSVRRTRYHSRR